MSRIGRLPVVLPKGIEFKMNGNEAYAKGPKGEVRRKLHSNMKVKLVDGKVQVIRPNDERQNKALHGLTRTLVNNMVVGVSAGFEKTLNVVGVGFKVDLKGSDLVMQLGFSHPVNFPAPKGIKFVVDSKLNVITVTGVDKEQVGQIAAEIRGIKPPEPYKGKGIMYKNERIRRKAGKSAATGTK